MFENHRFPRGSSRWGILGAAGINRRFIPGLKAAGHDIAIFGSRDPAKGQAAATEHGGERSGTYEEVLTASDVDAVYIPLPNSLHVPWSIRAAELGSQDDVDPRADSTCAVQQPELDPEQEDAGKQESTGLTEVPAQPDAGEAGVVSLENGRERAVQQPRDGEAPGGGQDARGRVRRHLRTEDEGLGRDPPGGQLRSGAEGGSARRS